MLTDKTNQLETLVVFKAKIIIMFLRVDCFLELPLGRLHGIAYILLLFQIPKTITTVNDFAGIA